MRRLVVMDAVALKARLIVAGGKPAELGAGAGVLCQ